MRSARHLKSNNFLTMIFIIVLLFTASVFLYKNIIDKIVDNRQMTIESFKEEQFNVIWTSLENLQLQADKEITKISKNIEEDILSLSNEELVLLQSDMTNDTFNKTLHEILISNIKGVGFNDINNHMNGIVVMTNDGYIEDFNYYRASPSSNSNVREWQVDLDHSYNKELELDAIDKLLNRHSGIIALESYDLTKNENHIIIDEMTYDSLLNVYLDEGLNGLKNYQIFVPYYITDFGDIFGNPDILHGSKVDNNKLIVAQEFNVYDQIMNSQEDLFNTEQIQNVITRYNDLLRLLYIFGISLISAVLSLVIYLCNIYNTLVYHEEELIVDNDEEEDSLLDSETQDNQEE